MGIVYIEDGEPLVFEAVQPVKLTPLRTWIERGEGEHFVAKRLRGADSRLTSETLKSMLAAGEELSGKDYDLYFEWTSLILPFGQRSRRGTATRFRWTRLSFHR